MSHDLPNLKGFKRSLFTRRPSIPAINPAEVAFRNQGIGWSRIDLYALARALCDGYQERRKSVTKNRQPNRHLSLNHRTPLPLEIALYILLLAECRQVVPPKSSKSLSVDSSRQESVYVDSNYLITGKIWFHTRPLTAEDLKKTWGMQLLTISSSIHGRLSWFELAIYEPDTERSGSEAFTAGKAYQHLDPCAVERVFMDELGDYPLSFMIEPPYSKDVPNSSDCREWYKLKLVNDHSTVRALRWESHDHHTQHKDDYSSKLRLGDVFDCQEEWIWEYVSPGDRIAVVACAQYQGSGCAATQASLRVWNRYEPRHLGLI